MLPVPVAGSLTRCMQAHMLSSSSLQGPRACICWIQRSQMPYSRQKWPSRAAAAGSQGISFKHAALRGSLNALSAHRSCCQLPVTFNCTCVAHNGEALSEWSTPLRPFFGQSISGHKHKHLNGMKPTTEQFGPGSHPKT